MNMSHTDQSHFISAVEHLGVVLVLVVTWSSRPSRTVRKRSLCALVWNGLSAATPQCFFLRARAEVTFSGGPGRQGFQSQRPRWRGGKHRVIGGEPGASFASTLFIKVIIITAQCVIQSFITVVDFLPTAKKPGRLWTVGVLYGSI